MNGHAISFKAFTGSISTGVGFLQCDCRDAGGRQAGGFYPDPLLFALPGEGVSSISD
jgi:hypothetical protein